MELYHEHKDYKLYHGDARSIELLPDKSVNLILADPPFGQAYQSGHRYTKFDPIKGDKYYPILTMQQCLFECHRVLAPKGAMYFFSGWNSIHKLGEQIAVNFKLGTPLVWVKNNWSAGGLENDWANRIELIVYAYKSGHRLLGGRPSNALFFKRVGKLTHPTEKPVPLLEYLISKSSNKGDTVLDMFMGSGSTIEAAIKLGRKAIGIDLDEKYCELAKKRMLNVTQFAFPDTEVKDNDYQTSFEVKPSFEIS